MSRTPRPTVLILCTANSCRSQIAEGLLRASAGDLVTVESAGSGPSGEVHPLAARVMAEIGIDISGQRSKHVDLFAKRAFDTVITVCGKADAACPLFPGRARRHHWGFDDPALVAGSEAERLAAFRRLRDAMRLVFDAYAAGLRDAR